MQRVYKAPYEGSFAPKPAILGRNRKWQGCPIGCRQLSTRVGRLGLLDQRPVSTEAAARADPRRQSATCQKRPAAGCGTEGGRGKPGEQRPENETGDGAGVGRPGFC